MLLQEEMARLQQEIETLKAERAPGEKVSLKLALSAISHFLAGVWKEPPFTPDREGTAGSKEGF